MIELYTAPTPNGWKISIMLEECGVPYDVRWVDIGQGEQFRSEFLRLNPNGKIPAIIDRAPVDSQAPISVFETGAILIYVAEKTGKFLPADRRERNATLEWLFWQVAGLGPTLGQHGHFKLYAPETIPYVIERFRRESLRLFGVMDKRLGDVPYLAGTTYTIADMATFPWVQTYKKQEVPLQQFHNVYRWYSELKERPALRRGMSVGRDKINNRLHEDSTARRILYGIRDGQE